MKKFNEINIGDKAEFKHTITQQDVDKFVQLTGDDNKIHIDKDFASKTPFKKPLIHGMLGASFISTIIGTRLPGDGALWFSQTLEFLLPVRVGDEITVRAEVLKKIENQNIIELQVDIFNQNRQKVTTGISKVRMIEPEPVERIFGQQKRQKKIALVVGGTGGIGRATCLQLANDGFDVVVHYNSNKESAQEIKEEIEKRGQKAIIVKGNIVDESQVKEMVEHTLRHFDTITVMVNCTTHPIANIKALSLDWQDMQNHLDINIKGTFNLIKNIVPIMEKEKNGRIITITTQAIETPNVGWLNYITAKSALNGFSKALAIELASKGIKVNMISPGMTETELISDIPEKITAIIAAKTPLKRLAKPEDIAGAISFLASDKADFITGETIRVNGGQVMI